MTDQTYDLAVRYPEVLAFYGSLSSRQVRMAALRATDATLVVYDGEDGLEGPFDPRTLPALQIVFLYGDVAIMRVRPGY